MRTFYRFFVFAVSTIIFFLVSVSVVKAESISYSPAAVNELTRTVTLEFGGLAPGGNYKVFGNDDIEIVSFSPSGTSYSLEVCGQGDNLKTDCNPDTDYFDNETFTYDLKLKRGDDTVADTQLRVNRFYPIVDLIPENPAPPDDINVSIEGRRPGGDDRNDYQVVFESKPPGGYKEERCFTSPGSGSPSWGTLGEGEYIIKISDDIGTTCEGGFTYEHIIFTVSEAGGGITERIQDPNNDDPLPGVDGDGLPPGPPGKNPCEGGVCKTAIGNLSTDIGAFSTQFLSIAIGLAGGIALVLMVIGSVRVLMSSGDPKNVGAGRDMIIAAVAGLLFLIFSVLILKFIGLNILGGII